MRPRPDHLLVDDVHGLLRSVADSAVEAELDVPAASQRLVVRRPDLDSYSDAEAVAVGIASPRPARARRAARRYIKLRNTELRYNPRDY